MAVYALRVELTETLAYWTVVDEESRLVASADSFLRHLRLGADRAEVGFPWNRGGFFLCCGRLVCSKSLVLDRRHQCSGAVSASVVVEVLAPGHHNLACVGFGGEVVPGQDLVSRVEKNASAAALSKHEPTLPIDLRPRAFGTAW